LVGRHRSDLHRSAFGKLSHSGDERLVQLGVEKLEQKALLSAGVLPHSSEHAGTAPVIADVARPPLHLSGYVYSGSGTVSPMGGVRATLNVAKHLVTLRNGRGTVQVKLTNVYKYFNTFTARTFNIIKGPGAFKAYRGQGHTSLTAVMIHNRVSVWNESFWA
jgi:hypothetical protein